MSAESRASNPIVIRGGTIVDGTGAAPFEGDVAIADGRITHVGSLDGVDSNAQIIDGSGCWVTPGFIDPHTHLDAQLCWDPCGSPSNLHGVTTVIMGLCGFGVAPCPEGGSDYLLRSLEVVEEIPYASTRAGVPFDWRTWAEYADHVAAQPLAVNAAGFVPHSALRYFAMGERARGEIATAEDRQAMVTELERALAAGAVGLATSRGPNHVDGFREPVPSRYADEEELEALVRACRGRIWQINVETKFSHDADALISEIERYAAWSRSAGARLTWTPLHAEPGETVWREVLAHNRSLNDGSVEVAPQITAVPITLLLRFDERSFFTAIPGWEDALAGFFDLPPAARKERLAAPHVRRAMRSEIRDAKHILAPHLDNWVFTYTPSRPDFAGETLTEAAARTGVHPADLLCDQIIADDLQTLINVPVANRSLDGAVSFLHDDLTLLGLGDSGAHVMSVANYRYPTFLLADLVKKGEALSVEMAIQRMTTIPARMHNLAQRGELRPGFAADVCVIDPERLRVGVPEVRRDLPGGSPRLFQPGHGYRAVLVNGRLSISEDVPTGEAAGELLRTESRGARRNA